MNMRGLVETYVLTLSSAHFQEPKHEGGIETRPRVAVKWHLLGFHSRSGGEITARRHMEGDGGALPQRRTRSSQRRSLRFRRTHENLSKCTLIPQRPVSPSWCQSLLILLGSECRTSVQG